MGFSILLVDLGSPANLGCIMRHIITLCGDYCCLYIFDPRENLIKYREKIIETSLGLSEKSGTYKLVGNLENFLKSYEGRIIKTEILKDSVSITDFNFQENDLILLGNENRGFETSDNTLWSGIEYAKDSIIIPMLGTTYKLPDNDHIVAKNFGSYPNLSVSSTAVIVTYVVMNQLSYFESFSLE